MSKFSGLSAEDCRTILSPNEEHDLVRVIRDKVLTAKQREWLNSEDITIEDMLNGRVEGHAQQVGVDLIFITWNVYLGQNVFGSR